MRIIECCTHSSGIDTDGDGLYVSIKGVSVYLNHKAGVRVQGGSATISNNLLGVNATGLGAVNINYGVEQTGGEALISSNYITSNTEAGIYINGGSKSTI